MGLRNAVTVLFLCLLASSSLKAQPNRNGVPIITNYEHAITKGSEQNWCITQDTRGVIYVGNNNKGVLEYDGLEWRRIPVPKDPIIRSLITGDDGVVYVGAYSEFGYLAPDETGNMHYRSLSDSVDQSAYPFENVMRTYYCNGKVYFCTFNTIFIYDHLQKSISILPINDHSYYSFLIDSTIYVSDFDIGLMRFEGDQLVLVPGGKFFAEMTITGLVSFDKSRVLAGTFYNGLFLLNTKTGEVDQTFIDQELNDYFREGNITYIRTLNNEFVVSNLNNGIVLLDRTGKATEIITEEEGLIDEHVPFVYSNMQMKGTSPIWIANYMGISKMELTNPFRVFTETSGFEGFITDIKVFNEKLFVSTVGGLYYKHSTSTSTRFIPLPGIQGDIRHLHIFRPAPRTEFLLASSDSKTYIIDKYMRISTLEERIVNLSEDRRDLEYSGRFLVHDHNEPDILYTGRSQIVGVQYKRGRWEEVKRIKIPQNESFEKMGVDKYNYLWTSSPGQVTRIDINQKRDPIIKFFYQENGLPADELNKVFVDPDTEEILFGTKRGFYKYNYFRDTIYRDTFHNQVLPEGDNYIMAFHKDMDGDYWYSFENEQGEWKELVARNTESGLQVIHEKSFQRLSNTSTDLFYSSTEGEVWFGKSNKLYHFDKSFAMNDSVPFRTLIRRVIIDNDSLIFNGTHFSKGQQDEIQFSQSQDKNAQPLIKYRQNNIEFTWAATFFEQENEIVYSYKLDGFDEEWSEWSKTPFKGFTNLPFGSFTMYVKSMNVYGSTSLPDSYSFTILRPWYAHILAIIGYIVLAGLMVYIIIKLYTRRLKQENLRLEGIIQERTAEIRKQKEELTDSIEYASRIQRALLPPEKLMDEHNLEHFILFRPRDIVSGDFYWIGSKNDKLLIVVADCTGHGVPGAFMSMLGMTFLDEIVIKSEITNTDEILEHLREHVITSLKQSGKSIQESTKDGMDLAMVSIDMAKGEFQYSGAYNPLYLVRPLRTDEKTKLKKGEELDLPRGSIYDDNNLLLHIRADQMPIGISEKKLPFNATSFKDEGYSIYMFSDGFLDQFGGPRKKKFMSKNFKKLILELQSISLKDQGAAMEKVLTGWMGEISQIDDILVMGLRLKEH